MSNVMDLLEGLKDEELRAVGTRSDEILDQRDKKRKADAVEQATAILATAGLGLKDIARKRASQPRNRATIYHSGHRYQHPAKKDLTWNAKGKKPQWLVALEREGGKAVEMPAVSVPQRAS